MSASSTMAVLKHFERTNDGDDDNSVDRNLQVVRDMKLVRMICIVNCKNLYTISIMFIYFSLDLNS